VEGAEGGLEATERMAAATATLLTPNRIAVRLLIVLGPSGAVIFIGCFFA
jgi:hypothetical protein